MDAIALCNMALSSIGHDKMIGSLDEAGRAAALCKLWLDSARRNVLSGLYWGGVARSVRMEGEARSAGRYRYHLPCDGALLQLRAYDPESGQPLEIVEVRGQHAYLTAPVARLSMVVDVALEEMPHLMQRAVVLELAALIAYGLTGKHDIAQRARDAAQLALSDARAQLGNVTRPLGDRNPYARARRGEEQR